MNTRSPDFAKLMTALLQVQRALPTVQTNKMNPHLKSRYADLAAVQAVCRPLLVENGLVVTHSSSTVDTVVTITATMVHAESGEWITSSVSMNLAQNTPQGVGSTLTYGRRYTLAALVGIVVDDDDDGHTGSTPAKEKPKNDLAEKKALIKTLLKVYKGADKDEIRGECVMMEEQNGWSVRHADSIIDRLSKHPLKA